MILTKHPQDSSMGILADMAGKNLLIHLIAI